MQTRWLLFACVWVMGCPRQQEPDISRSDEGSSDVSSDEPPPDGLCQTEDDCAAFGAGHMCMGGGCMVMETQAPPVLVPPPTAAATDLAPLVDEDPDPTRFETHLVATTGEMNFGVGDSTTVDVYASDAQAAAAMPGVLIDVEVGTTVVVHFTNLLAVPTSIHWHGLVLPAAMDGAPAHDDHATSGSSIAPGDTFDFEFVVRDASLFWFHPHVDADVQIERGLYGVLRVREPEPVAVDRERIVVLDDILLHDDGQIVPPDDGPAMTPDGSRMTFVSMMGRQGNHLLLNGARNPFIDVVAGQVERWRIVNVANSRFFRLSVPGHALVVVGSDVGLAANARTVDTLLIAPGERYDVLLQWVGTPGSTAPLLTLHHDRGHDMADPGPLTVATLRYADVAAPVATPLPTLAQDIANLEATATPAQTVRMEETLLRGAKVGFSLNGEMFPDVTPLHAEFGSEETWEIVNETHMDHPFHLHGFPFQVKTRAPLDGGDEVQETWLTWKDTVIVGPRERLRFVVRYDGFVGMWMFHCHILEHAERGMMSMISVEDTLLTTQ